jgi:hypothetical protein
MTKILFLLTGGLLYVGAAAVIVFMWYLMPAGSTFPVIIIVLPALPLIWLGSVCLRNGGAGQRLLWQKKR